MADEVYDIGDRVYPAITFTDAAGVALSPSAIAASYTTPAGVSVAVLAEDIEVLSSGSYRFPLDVAETGIYWARWVGTGADGPIVDEKSFSVRKRRVPTPT